MILPSCFPRPSTGQTFCESNFAGAELVPSHRNFIPIYERAIIFKTYGWQFENQKDPSHITVEYINHQSNKPYVGTTGLTTISTPGPTPLRTHMTVSTMHDGTTLPSLLPATGTTLILPPSSMSSTVQYSTTSMAIQHPDVGPTFTTDLEGTTTYDLPPSSSPSIHIISTKPSDRLHLPVSAIAAISSIGFFVGIIFLLWFFWLRIPRRRRLPIPSLPRLENGDIEEKGSLPESPLFGPKERYSQRTELHPQWSWVTYKQNKSACESKPQGDDNYNLRSGSTSVPRLPDVAITSHRNSSIYTASGRFQSLSAPVGSPQLGAGHPSLQQVQAAITHATNRMSAMSFTCASKYPDENSRNSGTAFTADGHDMMKRRSRTLRKSRSNSIYEDRRRSSRLPAGLAYDGADVTSPVPAVEFAALDSPNSNHGYGMDNAERRTRIQTPYYATGSYPRISSAMPATYGVATRVKLGDGTSIREFTSSKLKSETQRAKETQALTRALGLSSPTVRESIPSPQPTLGPDDSLSVVEFKRSLKRRSKRESTYFGADSRSRQDTEGYRQHQVTTPTRNVVAVASGSLVSAEDIKAQSSRLINNTGLAMSLTGPTSVNNASTRTKSALAPMKMQSRTGDKPPRVPSPPPLPSLAQMALEQHNPAAYAEYRSPTYSIYNLYDDNQRGTAYTGSKR